ncbi:MAG: rod shape-determining protein MreD, partial [Flavobacteriaceae bacterium]
MTDFSPLAVLRFLALFAVQVFIFNQIHWFGSVSPMVLVLFLYWTPIDRDILITMIGAFALGLITDVASDTTAFHAIALTVGAYLRPSILRLSYGSSVSFH